MTVPRRLSFSGQLSNCNPATCWHIELSILGLLHLSISIHLRNSFSCSMKFFHLKIVLWLALSESWLSLAQTQKNTDVYKGLLSWEGLPWQTCKNHLRDINSWIKFRLLYDNSFAPARSLCHGKEHHDIDPNMLSSGHHDCSTKAVFLWTAVKLQSCHVLAHWTQQTGPWAGLGRILAVACTNTEKHWCPQRHASQRRQIHQKQEWSMEFCCSCFRVQMQSKHVKFRTSWLFHKGCLSLHGWQTAMLAHVGTYWRMLAFSFLHILFIGTIVSVVLSSSFIWK